MDVGEQAEDLGGAGSHRESVPQAFLGAEVPGVDEQNPGQDGLTGDQGETPSVELMITNYEIIPYENGTIEIDFLNIFQEGDKFVFGVDDAINLRNSLTTAIKMVQRHEREQGT